MLGEATLVCEGMPLPLSIIPIHSTEGGLKPSAKFCFLSKTGTLGRRGGKGEGEYLLNQISGNIFGLQGLIVFV